MSAGSGSGEFTGRHMLLVMLAFFGVIIAVNVTMATLARTSWTGLVVQNTYVASQQFNGKAAAARAQAALGWKAEIAIAEGRISFRLLDAAGAPRAVESVVAVFRRPTTDADDRTVALARAGDGFAAAATLADGVWIVEFDAEAGLAAPWREVRRVMLAGGSAR